MRTCSDRRGLPSISIALSSLPPAPAGTVRVGLVATFGRWKGHETFLQALQALMATAPVRGYIIGDALYDTAGSQYTRADFERRIAALGMSGRVGLTGFIDRTSESHARPRRRGPRQHAARALRTGDCRRHVLGACRHRQRRGRRRGTRHQRRRCASPTFPATCRV